MKKKSVKLQTTQEQSGRSGKAVQEFLFCLNLYWNLRITKNLIHSTGFFDVPNDPIHKPMHFRFFFLSAVAFFRGLAALKKKP